MNQQEEMRMHAYERRILKLMSAGQEAYRRYRLWRSIAIFSISIVVGVTAIWWCQ